MASTISTTWIKMGAALGGMILLAWSTAPSAGDAAAGGLDDSVATVVQRPDLPSDLDAVASRVMPQDAPVLDAAAVRAAIEKSNANWVGAFHRGDSAALAGFYAPDASLFPPSNANLEGSTSIVEYFIAQRRAGMGDPSLKTLDVVFDGSVAYEVGVYGFKFDSPAEGFSGDAGRYFAIWKAQPDGSWLYQVGIWSSNRDVGEKR